MLLINCFLFARGCGFFDPKMRNESPTGAGPSAFPPTTWGLVSRLGRTAEHRAAFEDLCTRYWRPVHGYVRVAWSKSHEDAKDLTQAFFLWLLDGEPLKNYAPERGGFRPYLKVLLRRFVGHQDVALKRLKRGGGAKVLPIVDDGFVASGTDPEKTFDRAWIAELVNQAVARVRARTDAVGFQVYERFELAPEGERPTYAQLAERLSLSVRDVKNHLVRLREEVRREIRTDLREMTSDDGELEEEWNALFRS